MDKYAKDEHAVRSIFNMYLIYFISIQGTGVVAAVVLDSRLNQIYDGIVLQRKGGLKRNQINPPKTLLSHWMTTLLQQIAGMYRQMSIKTLSDRVLARI